MDKVQIQILTTGGTIEKSYNEKDGSLKNRNSMLRNRLLKKIRLPHTQILVEEIMAVDSLEMTAEDRQFILSRARDKIAEAPSRPLIILHGTDTMVHTATLFHQVLTDIKAPVVFTGAMRPMGFEDSDATQNIVEALIGVQLLAPGVYLSFHNHIHPLPHVKKDKPLGTFVGTS